MTHSSTDTRTVPLRELARDPHPDRQVRTGGIHGIDIHEIERLYTQETPNEWGEIIVRPWPEDELHERPDDAVKYQVLIGNHRYVTARDPAINGAEFGIAIGLDLGEIDVIIRDWDDATYYRESVQSNRGPAPLTAEDKAVAVKRMQALYPDASQADLAKMLNVTKSYVQAVLTNRNTMRGPRPARQHTSATTADSPPDIAASLMGNPSSEQRLPAAWQVDASDDERAIVAAGQAIADLLSCTPGPDLSPAVVRGYVDSLRADERRDTTAMVAELATWLAHFQVVLAQRVEEVA